MKYKLQTYAPDFIDYMLITNENTEKRPTRFKWQEIKQNYEKSKETRMGVFPS